MCPDNEPPAPAGQRRPYHEIIISALIDNIRPNL